MQLDITVEFFFFSFYFVYTSACNLVFGVRVIAVKVTVSVCEDRVKLNYFRLILNHKEPYTDYTENKEITSKRSGNHAEQ